MQQDELSEVRTVVKSEKGEASRIRRWHLVISVIGVVTVLIVQTVGIAWWAATISGHVREVRSARIYDRKVQKEIDARQDADILRNDDRRIAELREINQKLDWLIKNRR